MIITIVVTLFVALLVFLAIVARWTGMLVREDRDDEYFIDESTTPDDIGEIEYGADTVEIALMRLRASYPHLFRDDWAEQWDDHLALWSLQNEIDEIDYRRGMGLDAIEAGIPDSGGGGSDGRLRGMAGVWHRSDPQRRTVGNEPFDTERVVYERDYRV